VVADLCVLNELTPTGCVQEERMVEYQDHGMYQESRENDDMTSHPAI
jgi:hypothetical protein